MLLDIIFGYCLYHNHNYLGTFTSLIQASNFVQTIEERQGFGVGCIEAVAYSNGFINDAKLKELAIPLLKSGYGNYLMSLID